MREILPNGLGRQKCRNRLKFLVVDRNQKTVDEIMNASIGFHEQWSAILIVLLDSSIECLNVGDFEIEPVSLAGSLASVSH
jgi:hypothetical protein